MFKWIIGGDIGSYGKLNVPVHWTGWLRHRRHITYLFQVTWRIDLISRTLVTGAWSRDSQNGDVNNICGRCYCVRNPVKRTVLIIQKSYLLWLVKRVILICRSYICRNACFPINLADTHVTLSWLTVTLSLTWLSQVSVSLWLTYKFKLHRIVKYQINFQNKCGLTKHCTTFNLIYGWT